MTVPIPPIHHDPKLAAAQGQVARKYQEEIFQQAQKGNVIAYLRTGSGKTLISVLLIKWISTQEKARGKLIVFLVPKVSLVEQQAKYIEEETGLRVDRLHGALARNFADRQGWKKQLESHDVAVATPQLFIELITHSLWSIDRVSLMVFDECHHARKNHPYNWIMREYSQVQDISKRPKIFGMTASPYWNEKNPALSLSTLESNLQCKIVGVHEHVEELHANFSQLDEILQEYPFPPIEWTEYPSPMLYDALKVFYVNSPDLFDQLGIPWLKMEMRYYMTLNNLGPYSASLYLYSEMQHHLGPAMKRAQEILAVEADEEAMEVDADIRVDMFDIVDILDDYAAYFEPEEDDSLPIAVPLNWNSPKVRVLVDLIRKHQKKDFQCIIFVEQRQVAFCLAKVLEAMPEARDFVRCGHLVGQGVNAEGVSNQLNNFKGDAIKMFREKYINVLIATSVAEEGLDFPACDLVIRFDPLQHLVGYVQSRGRARSKASQYVIMIQQDNLAQLERYRALQQGESELSRTYHTKSPQKAREWVEDSDPFDNTDPRELAERDRIVIPSTGAVLTYDNAMGLLAHLCSLIPRDAFTPIQKPVYTGEFQCRLRLPASLPLASKHLAYIGYPKSSKKEARRSVAFLAVKHLLRLNVFNEYLLPVAHEALDEDEEITEQRKKNEEEGNAVPEFIEVKVKDPWYLGEKLWLHHVLVDGKVTAGLVTGTSLPSVEVYREGRVFQLCQGTLIPPETLERSHSPRHVMNDWMRWCVRARNTGRPLPSPFCSFTVVPLTQQGGIDFERMAQLVQRVGCSDWSLVKEEMYDHIFVLNRWESGRTMRLKKIRSDLSVKMTPPGGSREAGHGTYYDYFVKKWTRKKREVTSTMEGPLLEVVVLPKISDSEHPLDPLESDDRKAMETEEEPILVPQSECLWVHFPLDLSDLFGALPILARRITDVYRARAARLALRLPSISDNLLIEALTLPTANRAFNNQRLETLGDAVLELCTTVQLLNQFPNRHEGQLSSLRQQYIANKYLMSRAREFGLEAFLSCEVTSLSIWRYTTEVLEVVEGGDGRPRREATVTYPRRNLQDCMEALLGASYLQGGLGMALRTGASLGLNFGGTTPWTLRYDRGDVPEVAPAPLFANLQDKLGYQFRHNDILVEAVTHPSFASSEGTSYQRLEFLGDAVLNLVVVDYLYKKFPAATSHELTYLRAKIVCASTLAYLAATQLSLHKTILANSLALWRALDQHVPVLTQLSPAEIVKRSWRYDPPKALSDVFEAVVGAVLVDSGWDWERAASVAEGVMRGVLEELSLKMATNPVSELVEWCAKRGCTKVEITRKAPSAQHSPAHRRHTAKTQTNEVDNDNDEGVLVRLHGTTLAGPVVATSRNVARFIAAERALALLSDATSPHALEKLCTCAAVDAASVSEAKTTAVAAKGEHEEVKKKEKDENIGDKGAGDPATVSGAPSMTDDDVQVELDSPGGSAAMAQLAI